MDRVKRLPPQHGLVNITNYQRVITKHNQRIPTIISCINSNNGLLTLVCMTLHHQYLTLTHISVRPFAVEWDNVQVQWPVLNTLGQRHEVDTPVWLSIRQNLPAWYSSTSSDDYYNNQLYTQQYNWIISMLVRFNIVTMCDIKSLTFYIATNLPSELSQSYDLGSRLYTLAVVSFI